MMRGCHYEIPRCQNELLRSYPVDGVKYVFHTLSQPQVNGSSRLRWCSFFFIYLTTDIHLIVHDLSVICPSTPKTTVLFKKPKKKHNVWKLAKNLYSTKNWAGQHFNANKMLEIMQPIPLGFLAVRSTPKNVLPLLFLFSLVYISVKANTIDFHLVQCAWLDLTKTH